jgi:hypothetical protein
LEALVKVLVLPESLCLRHSSLLLVVAQTELDKDSLLVLISSDDHEAQAVATRLHVRVCSLIARLHCSASRSRRVPQDNLDMRWVAAMRGGMKNCTALCHA